MPVNTKWVPPTMPFLLRSHLDLGTLTPERQEILAAPQIIRSLLIQSAFDYVCKAYIASQKWIRILTSALIDRDAPWHRTCCCHI